MTWQFYALVIGALVVPTIMIIVGVTAGSHWLVGIGALWGLVGLIGLWPIFVRLNSDV